MTKRWIKQGGIVMTVALAATLAAGCGAKKKPGDRTQFDATFAGIMKNMNGNSHSLDERQKYTVSQLGPPHRTEADALYWYTPPPDICFYYKMSMTEGYGSTGTGAKEDCEKWGK